MIRAPASSSPVTPSAISSGVSLVNDFHVLNDGKPGIRLRHDRKLARFPIELHGVRGECHVDTGAAVEGDDVRAFLDHEHRRLLGARAHHRADVVAR